MDTTDIEIPTTTNDDNAYTTGTDGMIFPEITVSSSKSSDRTSIPYVPSTITSVHAYPAGGSVLLCENNTEYINCPLPFVIDIIGAYHGRNDTATCHTESPSMMCHSDVTITSSVTGTGCQDKNGCMLSTDRQIYGNACIGKHPYLMVTYKCTLPEPDLKQTSHAQLSFQARYTNIDMNADYLWRVHIQNVGLCGIHCRNDRECLSFAFDPNQKICQGHKTALSSEVEGHGSSGNHMLYFELKWCDGDGFLYDVTGVCYGIYGIRHNPAECQKECSRHNSRDGKVVGSLMVLNTPQKLQNMWLKTREDSWLRKCRIQR
ncbi:uncharacterized protein [Argopecten irradians]|uniref:uncharacterized protein n=1 Tax=Argopecten irradians TaxID=31199 RepID=UPI00371BB65A